MGAGSLSIALTKSLIPGLNVVGWNILTQLLTENNPTLVTAHIPRYIELRNSYQNRPNIGLAILWSVGQAGAKSLHSGIKGRRKSYMNGVYFVERKKAGMSFTFPISHVYHHS